jgi:hypothetical protein
MALQPVSIGLGRFFKFHNPLHGRTPWMGDKSSTYTQDNTHTHTHIQNKRTETSMPRVGFEITTPAFERMKTVYALDRATSGSALTKGYRHIGTKFHALSAFFLPRTKLMSNLISIYQII